MDEIDSKNGQQPLLAPGTVVGGHYVVDECLGVGSSTSVYRCHHREHPSRIFALKVLHPSVARDDVVAERFQKEVLASYEVNHDNVIQTFEYISKGPIVAFTMEYVSGGDLRTLLSSEKDLALKDVLSLLGQIAAGLQAIHQAGIVHRDLKPANLLLTKKGEIKIADFGLAKMNVGRQLTRRGDVVGAIDYVSPEYLQSGKVDKRSDIYALGLLGYEMITGKFPFSKGANAVESIMRRLTTNPQPPHEIRGDCPRALSAIILKALYRNPDERYQSVQEMLDELRTVNLSKKDDQNVEDERSISREMAYRELEPRHDSMVQTFESIDMEGEGSTREFFSRSIWGITAIISLCLLAVIIGYPWVKANYGSLTWDSLSRDFLGKGAEMQIVDGEQLAPVVTAVHADRHSNAGDSAVADGYSAKQDSLEAYPAGEESEIKEITPEMAASVLGDERSYQVVAGDTISHIAQKLAVAPAQLMSLNGISDPRKLQVGMVLKVPKG